MNAWQQPAPPVLYKYLSPNRLDLLTDCRVRFTQRVFFQDDHELQPDYDAYGTAEEIERQIRSTGTGLIPGVPESVLARLIADNPKYQKIAMQSAVKNIKSVDVMGILCLTTSPDSERMWYEYASQDTGFVIGFDTTHVGFGKLTAPRSVGKVTYSGAGFPSFLGMLEKDPYEPLFRKRTEYSFEQEWRSLRLLKDLERFSEHVFLSSFDPTCIREIIIGRNCPVESPLRDSAARDNRFQHVQIERR
jgi:hypothetical protein